MSPKHQNYVDGRWSDSTTGETFESTNPATGETLGVFPKSGPDDVEAAVKSARKAFNTWRLVPAPRRAEILFRAAEMMVERKEHLARTVTEEMGKVISEARGEVQEAIDTVYYIAGEGRRMFGQTMPAEMRDKFAMTVRMPFGVVAAITPWNFPIAIPCWKLAPALVVGNTVVLKPASDTPLVATKLVEIFLEAGLPEGVLNMVTGPGGSAGSALVEHPDVAMISFTGSTLAGRGIAETATRNLKRVSLEMGGKNPIIVLADADLDLAAQGIIWSAFGTSGQRCSAGSRVIVQREVAENLLSRLVPLTEKLRVGNGLDESVQVGPIVNESQLKRIDGYVRIGKEEGARLVTGGKVLNEGELADGFYYAPTIFDRVTPSMRIAQEEIFGPVVSIIQANNLEQAIEIANGTSYGLTSGIYTQDVNNAFTAMRDLFHGIVYINSGTIGAEIQLPFGGTKGSGNGHREVGPSAIDTYSEWKSIFVDFSGRLQRAQIDLEETGS